MTIFYNIWFVFFFLCLVCLLWLCAYFTFIYVFVLSPSVLLWPTTLMNPFTDTIILFPVLLTKTFLNFILCFFCHLPVAQLHLSLLCPTTNQQRKNYSLQTLLSVSLSISLIYINKRQSHKHRVTESQSQKAKQKKNTTCSSIESNSQSIHKAQHKSTTDHKAQHKHSFYFLWISDSQITKSQTFY